MIAHVLSIAGLDPSGGAGIAADLKTFAALGTYGMAVATAITAQNTVGVSRVEVLDAELVDAQLRDVLSDIHVHAIKVGMLGNAPVARRVAKRLDEVASTPVVFDPVMGSTTGASLADTAAVDVMRDAWLPRVTVLTPNLREAARLLDQPQASDVDEMVAQADTLRRMGPRWVLLKGGHLGGSTSPDVLAGPEGISVFHGERIATRHGHGTGCTLAAAVAAGVAQGRDVPEAVERGRRFLRIALAAADELRVGRGAGPVHHGALRT